MTRRQPRRLLPLLLAVAFCSFASLRAQETGRPPLSLTIDEAVDLALERNPVVRQAQAQVSTSSARVTGAFGAFLPELSLQSSYTRQLDADETVVIGGIPIRASRPDNYLTANASASLLLFDGFARTANYGAAQHAYDAAAQSLGHVRRQVAFQARAAFLAALRAEQAIDIRRSELEVATDRLERTRQLVELGTAQLGQVYSQESEVATAELALEQARGDALVARNSLALVLNVDPAIPLQLGSASLASSVDSAEIATARATVGSLESLLATQLAERLDIRAARLRLQAADASLRAARSGYWPTLSSALTYSWQKPGGSEASGSTQLALNLQYTPFDNFRTSERVELAEAERLNAALEVERLEAQARSDLQGAWVRLETAQRQLRAAEKAVAAARQNRYAADERQQVGVGTEAEYLLANAQLVTAQINLLNAVFNYRLALFELRYLAGL